jgi:hypothetical protein
MDDLPYILMRSSVLKAPAVDFAKDRASSGT